MKSFQAMFYLRLQENKGFKENIIIIEISQATLSLQGLILR